MSDITLLTTGDLIMVFLVAGSPGGLIRAVVGSRLWKAQRVAGALLGGIAGFILSLLLAFGALLVFVK
jgi:hypothetical protein